MNKRRSVKRQVTFDDLELYNAEKTTKTKENKKSENLGEVDEMRRDNKKKGLLRRNWVKNDNLDGVIKGSIIGLILVFTVFFAVDFLSSDTKAEEQETVAYKYSSAERQQEDYLNQQILKSKNEKAKADSKKYMEEKAKKEAEENAKREAEKAQQAKIKAEEESKLAEELARQAEFEAQQAQQAEQAQIEQAQTQQTQYAEQTQTAQTAQTTTVNSAGGVVFNGVYFPLQLNVEDTPSSGFGQWKYKTGMYLIAHDYVVSGAGYFNLSVGDIVEVNGQKTQVYDAFDMIAYSKNGDNYTDYNGNDVYDRFSAGEYTMQSCLSDGIGVRIIKMRAV